MGNDAKKEANKQELQMKNTKYDTTSVPSTKYGVVKKLGAITGTVANNMSVAQYNTAIKMSGIAKNMDEPIKKIDPNYNGVPGVQQEDFEQYK